MKINNPGEFLDYCKIAYQGLIPHEYTAKQTQYKNVLLERAKGGIPGDMLQKMQNMIKNGSVQDFIIQSLYDRHFSDLPVPSDQSFKTKIAVGVINNLKVNAAILKNPHGFFAILINQGLLLYLNKFIKYLLASRNPEVVLYLDGVDAKKIGEQHYRSLINALTESYKSAQVAKGPKVVLNKEFSGRQGAFLEICELFILCHELGHYFNGDLNDNDNMIGFGEDASQAYLLQEGKSFDMEFEADQTGFELCVRLLGRTDSNLAAVLAPLVVCFDCLGMLYGDESNSHPAPRARVINIANKFYSTEVATAVEESYLNGEFVLGDNIVEAPMMDRIRPLHEIIQSPLNT